MLTAFHRVGKTTKSKAMARNKKRDHLGVLNSRSNSFQLGKHDTNHLDKQMIKDTTNTSQLNQLSQQPR